MAGKETLPPLRQDLHLFKGTRRFDGAPTWTLFDPVRNRYFQLLEKEFHIVSCWNRREPSAVAEEAARRAGYDITEDDVNALLEFLLSMELLDASRSSVRRTLSEHQKRKQTRILDLIIYKYLFFRLPLVRPDGFLTRLYPFVRPLFSGLFVRISIGVALVAWILSLRKWDDFLASFASFATGQGVVLFFVTLLLVKIVHELGHGLALKHYGLKVPTMGVAFLVLWPVLYTDASDAWRLTSRRDRAIISAAGIISELLMASYALLLWVLLPDGPLRDAVFIIATTSWVLSLFINLNPLLRFDGYYFLSDVTNVPNLQTRSFRFGKWHLRNAIFGLNAPPPESLSPRLSRFLVVFAYAVWIYRFFLFLSIALLVYNLFFKVLGVFLFLVEIWWFIFRPIFNEIREWKNAWKQADKKRLLIVGSVLGGFLLVFFFPWQSRIVAPAVLENREMSRVFSMVPGQLDTLHVEPGEQVEPGTRLMTFTDPGRALKARVYLHGVDLARERVRGRRWDEESLDDRIVMEQRLEEARLRYRGHIQESMRLLVEAPHGGQVVDLAREFHEGRWVGPGTHLLSITGQHNNAVTAWFSESDIQVLDSLEQGRFYPEATYSLSPLRISQGRLDLNSVSDLSPPYHASEFGGSIKVTREDETLKPENTLYRARFRVTEDAPADFRVRGWVHLTGDRRSFAERVWRWFWGTLLRESGF